MIGNLLIPRCPLCEEGSQGPHQICRAHSAQMAREIFHRELPDEDYEPVPEDAEPPDEGEPLERECRGESRQVIEGWIKQYQS